MCIVSKNNTEYLQKDLDICKNHCLNFFKANFCIFSCKIIAIHFLTQLSYFCLQASCQKRMHDDFIFPITWEVQMSCCCNCILMYQFIMSICSQLLRKAIGLQNSTEKQLNAWVTMSPTRQLPLPSYIQYTCTFVHIHL